MEEDALITATEERKVPGIPFVKGDSRINYAGRPKGSISPITRVKQIFEENPEQFAEFISEYIKDPSNRKHIVEMIDGKPQQDITTGGDKIVIPIYGGLSNNNSNNKDIPTDQEN